MRYCFFILIVFLSACSPQVSSFVNEASDNAVVPSPTKTISPSPFQSPAQSPTPEPTKVSIPTPTQTPANTPPVVPPPKDRVVDNKMTFFSQAPYELWDELHQEACEEASMIMVNYFKKEKKLDRHTMEQEILSLVSWQKENGYQVDITAQQVQNILQLYYNIESELSLNVSVDSMKEALDAGHVIIVPAAGRMLKNPYFSGRGPIYHMLVVRGYDENTKEFITNDPGTKRGEGFRYSYSRLLNAIHDWPKPGSVQGSVNDAEMEKGVPAMVIIQR